MYATEKSPVGEPTCMYLQRSSSNSFIFYCPQGLYDKWNEAERKRGASQRCIATYKQKRNVLHKSGKRSKQLSGGLTRILYRITEPL